MEENKQTTFTSTNCKNCNGKIEIDADKEVTVCPFCGTKYATAEILRESDAVRLEKLKLQAEREREQRKRENAREQEALAKQKNEADLKNLELHTFKNGAFSKVLLVFFAFSALGVWQSFSHGRIARGLIALLMAALFIGAWLMGMQLIKAPKKGFHTVLAIAAFVLIIPFFTVGGGSSYTAKAQAIEWDTLDLGEKLPVIQKGKGHIYSNSHDRLSLSIDGYEEKDYKAYRDACIAFGYTVEAEESSSSYRAFNEEGYCVKLNRLSSKLDIQLDAPETLAPFEWPTNGLAVLLPQPASAVGRTMQDSGTAFEIKVGETTPEVYKAYVKACEEAGFTANHNKTDTAFSASNADGYRVTVSYLGFRVMKIRIEAPEVSEAPEASEAENSADGSQADVPADTAENEPVLPDTAPETDTSDSANETGLRPDFKAAMDSYEAFMGEYCDFMAAYSENPSDLTLIGKYATYLEKYTKLTEDFDKWNSEDMNAAELAYYTEVQARVSKKLLEGLQ